MGERETTGHVTHRLHRESDHCRRVDGTPVDDEWVTFHHAKREKEGEA